MKLEEYLDALRNCPDEEVEIIGTSGGRQSKFKIPKLTALYGVYDNYPIYYRVDYQRVVDVLMQNPEKFQLEHSTFNEDRGKYETSFMSIPNQTRVRVFDYFFHEPWMYLLDSCRKDYGGEKAANLAKKVIDNFPRTIFLHCFHKKNIVGSTNQELIRAEGNTIFDIGHLLIKEKIPACFANTVYLENLDLKKELYKEMNKKIIFFEPKKGKSKN